MNERKMENLMKEISRVIEHENKKFLDEKIILNEVNSCLKVLHQLENQDPLIKESIDIVKESVIKNYQDKLYKEYSDRESFNMKMSFDISKHHESLNPERKKFRDIY